MARRMSPLSLAMAALVGSGCAAMQRTWAFDVAAIAGPEVQVKVHGKRTKNSRTNSNVMSNPACEGGSLPEGNNQHTLYSAYSSTPRMTSNISRCTMNNGGPIAINMKYAKGIKIELRSAKHSKDSWCGEEAQPCIMAESKTV